jgi:hypothetical protein
MYRNGHKSGDAGETVEALYAQLLTAFYEKANRAQARTVAARLEKALAASPDAADSIRAEEIRSLLAELRGDLRQATESREAEIRKILELHSLTVRTPGWAYVVRRYDLSDVSDRLDLLAVLYDRQGDVDRAIATLHESEQYCQAHRIPFDGQDLLEELERARTAEKARRATRKLAPDGLDEAIRASYRRFGTPADEIVVDVRKARQFTSEVNRRLTGAGKVSVRDVTRRLLLLRRRGAAKGGLPRLRRERRSSSG